MSAPGPYPDPHDQQGLRRDGEAAWTTVVGAPAAPASASVPLDALPAPDPGGRAVDLPPPFPSAASPAPAPMQEYHLDEPDPAPRVGATMNGAIAAALLGFQSAIPILGGVVALLLSRLVSGLEEGVASELGGDDGGIFGTVDTEVAVVAIVMIVYGVLLLVCSAGLALGKPVARIVVMVVEALTIGYLGYRGLVDGGILATLASVVVPSIVLTLAATDPAFRR